MDSATKILLAVGLTTEEFDKKLLASGEKLDKLKNKKKELQAELDKGLNSGEIVKGTEAYDNLRIAINKNNAEIKIAQDSMKALEKQQQNIIKINEEDEQSNNQLRAALSLLTAEYNKLSDTEKVTTQKGEDLKKNINEITETLKHNESAVGDNRRSVGDYTKIVAPLVDALKNENIILEKNNQELQQQRRSIADILKPTKEQENQIKSIDAQLQKNNETLKANHDQIGFLAGKYDDASNSGGKLEVTIGELRDKLANLKKQVEDPNLSLDEFQKLNEEIRKTQLEIDQAAGKVDEFGNKEPKNPTKKAYEDATEAAAGLTSAIALTTIAFGKSDSLQELQAKSLQAIAIAQNVQNIAKARGAIIDTAALIKTKALTIAQLLYSQVVGKSTGAMKVFKLALAGTGIGAIIVLLGELIFNFDNVAKFVNKATSGFDDFTTRISGGSKILKAVFTAIGIALTGGLAPLILLIKLINDFGGTINQIQNFINGVINEIGSFTDKLGFLGKQLRFVQGLFNFVADGIKSLDKSQGKFKVNLEALTKVYENYNQEIEKNKKKIDDQIRVAKAQGQSEEKLATLTKQSLQATVKARELSYNKAVEIANKLIKQNGKLNDEQQKLFDQAQTDFENSQLDLTVFEEEQKQARIQKWKEQTQARKAVLEDIIKAEMDFRVQRRVQEIQAIEDEHKRQQEELKFAFEQEVAAIDESLKNLKGSEQDKADAIAQANALKMQLETNFNTNLNNLNQKFLEDQLKKEQEAFDNSFAGKTKALSDQFKLDNQFAEASIQDTEKLEEEKLRIKIKFYQDQLDLIKQFAAANGAFTQQDIDNINSISKVIDDANAKLQELQNKPKLIEGLGLTQQDIDDINFAAQQIQSIIGAISDVINADANNRIRAIDDAFKFEQAKIQESTASQADKEKKINALTKKAADEKYAIELEQFRANKATQIVNTTIAGAVAAIQSLAQLGPIAGAIAAGVVAATTAVQIGIIASQPEPPKPSFFDGGFTEDGNPRLKSRFSNRYRDLHFDEYVTPSRVKRNPKAWPHIAALELLRSGTPKLGIGGFADGGFVGRELANQALGNLDLQNAIGVEVAKQMAKTKYYVQVTEVTKKQSEVNSTNAVRAL